jgi:WD40 repeat protein
MSADSRWLATGGDNGAVRLWDLQSASPSLAPVVLGGHAKRIAECTFGPDSRWLVTTSDEGTVQLWDVTTPNPRSRGLDGDTAAVRGVTFSPDGRWLVTSGDQVARLWDLHAPRPEASGRAFPPGGAQIRDVTFSPDSRWIVTVDSERQPRAWDLRAADTLTLPFVLGGAGYRAQVAVISPDSRWVATTGAPDPIALRDPVVRLFDLSAADPSKATLSLLGHERGVSAISMSPDASVLITGGTDSTVRFWNLRSGSPSDSPIVMSGQQGRIRQLVVSPDGRWVASAADDVRVWPLRGSDLIAPAMRAAGRNFTPDEWALFFPGQPYRRTFTELPDGVAPRDR